jgi:hypothetical protein
LGGPVAAVLSRMTVRERALAAGLGLIVLIAGAVAAMDWARDQQDRELAAVAAQQVRQQAMARAARGGLDPAARAQLAAADGWSLRAPDIWIARVRIEEQLAGAAAQAGVRDAEIEVAAGADQATAVPTVRAEVSGAYSKLAFVRLLHAVHAGPNAVLVERVQAQTAEDPRFKLVLAYPVEPQLAAARP